MASTTAVRENIDVNGEPGNDEEKGKGAERRVPCQEGEPDGCSSHGADPRVFENAQGRRALVRLSIKSIGTIGKPVEVERSCKEQRGRDQHYRRDGRGEDERCRQVSEQKEAHRSGGPRPGRRRTSLLPACFAGIPGSG